MNDWEDIETIAYVKHYTISSKKKSWETILYLKVTVKVTDLDAIPNRMNAKYKVSVSQCSKVFFLAEEEGVLNSKLEWI